MIMSFLYYANLNKNKTTQKLHNMWFYRAVQTYFKKIIKKSLKKIKTRLKIR